MGLNRINSTTLEVASSGDKSYTINLETLPENHVGDFLALRLLGNASRGASPALHEPEVFSQILKQVQLLKGSSVCEIEYEPLDGHDLEVLHRYRHKKRKPNAQVPAANASGNTPVDHVFFLPLTPPVAEFLASAFRPETESMVGLEIKTLWNVSDVFDAADITGFSGQLEWYIESRPGSNAEYPRGVLKIGKETTIPKTSLELTQHEVIQVLMRSRDTFDYVALKSGNEDVYSQMTSLMLDRCNAKHYGTSLDTTLETSAEPSLVVPMRWDEDGDTNIDETVKEYTCLFDQRDKKGVWGKKKFTFTNKSTAATADFGYLVSYMKDAE